MVLMLVPLIAMQFTNQVNWTAADFEVLSAMLLAVGIPLELAARFIRNRAYVAPAALALLGSFFVTWVNLAASGSSAASTSRRTSCSLPRS
jgi:hypothetical protein